MVRSSTSTYVTQSRDYEKPIRHAVTAVRGGAVAPTPSSCCQRRTKAPSNPVEARGTKRLFSTKAVSSLKAQQQRRVAMRVQATTGRAIVQPVVAHGSSTSGRLETKRAASRAKKGRGGDAKGPLRERKVNVAATPQRNGMMTAMISREELTTCPATPSTAMFQKLNLGSDESIQSLLGQQLKSRSQIIALLASDEMRQAFDASEAADSGAAAESRNATSTSRGADGSDWLTLSPAGGRSQKRQALPAFGEWQCGGYAEGSRFTGQFAVKREQRQEEKEAGEKEKEILKLPTLSHEEVQQILLGLNKADLEEQVARQQERRAGRHGNRRSSGGKSRRLKVAGLNSSKSQRMKVPSQQLTQSAPELPPQQQSTAADLAGFRQSSESSSTTEGSFRTWMSSTDSASTESFDSSSPQTKKINHTFKAVRFVAKAKRAFILRASSATSPVRRKLHKLLGSVQRRHL